MNSTTPDNGRNIWMDTAKGLCILLVVLWHVIWKHYLHVDWGVPPVVPAAWSAFGRALLPMRMPLFFLISGMLAVSAVNRPWPVVRRTKIARFGYLYLLWLLIHSVVLALLPIPFDTEIARSGWELLEQATIYPTTLWYLYALAAYFVVAKLVRRLPASLVLVVAFALSTASAAGWIYSPGNNASLYQNLVWFLAGLYLRPAVEDMARWSGWVQVVTAGAAFVVCLGVLARFDAMKTPLVWPITSMVATVFAVLLMARVSRWPGLRWVLSTLGRRTLPIYVMHLPLLAYAHWLLSPVLVELPYPVRLVLMVVEPVLLTAALVWVCLLVQRLALKVRAGWVFELPTRRQHLAPPSEPFEPVTVPFPRLSVESTTVRLPARVARPRPYVQSIR